MYVLPSMSATFGPGTGPILMNNVHCAGAETDLDDCLYSNSSLTDICSHYEDAGVACVPRSMQGKVYLYVKLRYISLI